MNICKNCNTSMKQVVSFSKDKHEKFRRCPKCHSETKHKNLQYDELDFRELLNKEIQKIIHEVGVINGSRLFEYDR